MTAKRREIHVCSGPISGPQQVDCHRDGLLEVPLRNQKPVPYLPRGHWTLVLPPRGRWTLGLPLGTSNQSHIYLVGAGHLGSPLVGAGCSGFFAFLWYSIVGYI
ncbi:UNVERIFIED_CONTAM: hypothetical protein FKN15_035233 [Acipenser sinensis]